MVPSQGLLGLAPSPGVGKAVLTLPHGLSVQAHMGQGLLGKACQALNPQHLRCLWVVVENMRFLPMRALATHISAGTEPDLGPGLQ